MAQPAQGGPPRARRSTAAATPRAAPAEAQKLVCTSGPSAGQEFPLESDEVVIGRSADNAIAIPDTSVSRKHVLLRRTNEGWAASDMGSGNGTLVNSNAIAEETVLNNGDTLAMGDTEFQFVDEGGSRPKRPAADAGGRRPVVRSARARAAQAADPDAPAKRKKLLLRGGAVVGVLICGFVGWKIIDNKRQAAAAVQHGVIQRTMDQLRTMNQQGRNLIRDGKWAEAKALFEQVLEAKPDFGGGTVQQYIAKCEEEIPNEKHLLAAADFLRKGEVGKAQLEFNQVTAGTLQVDRKEKVRGDLDAKVATKLGEAQDLVPHTSDRAKMAELQAIANDILVAREDQRDAKEFKEVADKAIDRIDHPYVAPPAPKTPWVPVQQTFQSGDQAGALAMANACANGFKQCRTLVEQIKNFNEKNKKLESLPAAELLLLLELDKKITGGSASALSKPIAVRVVGSFYQKASSAKAKGDWGQAIEYARKVLIADPGHPGAQSIIGDARSQAKDMYLRGYQSKDNNPDEAMNYFKQVLQMTPKDDEYHAKAKKQLDALKQ